MDLGLHSLDYAAKLVENMILNGLQAKIRPVKIEFSSMGFGMVMIAKSDLEKAIIYMETSPMKRKKERFAKSNVGHGTRLLVIPVDFSSYSYLAVTAGFDFAVRLNLHPIILHSYAPSVLATSAGFTDSSHRDLPDSVMGSEVEKKAELRMAEFCRDLREKQYKGELINVNFSSFVAQGLPEELIAEYCREVSPEMIVMATRGRQRRQSELIGSVTAEVIDTCRVPVFTVPEHLTFNGVAAIKRLLFFCNLDHQDERSIDWLMSMFDKPEVDIFLVPVSEGSDDSLSQKMTNLKEGISQKYPQARFIFEIPPRRNFREKLEIIVEEKDIQLFIVPNKKTNIFSRLFKPGIAHKILFEKDIPMLALPV